MVRFDGHSRGLKRPGTEVGAPHAPDQTVSCQGNVNRREALIWFTEREQGRVGHAPRSRLRVLPSRYVLFEFFLEEKVLLDETVPQPSEHCHHQAKVSSVVPKKKAEFGFYTSVTFKYIFLLNV